MTTKTITTSVLALTLALVACGDDSNIDPSPDASTVDASVSPLVGKWKRENFQDVDSTSVVSFTEQGGLRWGETSGKWRITDDGRLKAGAPPVKPVGTADYYLSPDHDTLMLEVLLPTTPTNGLLGTWQGTYQFADDTFAMSKMEFRADNTMTWSVTQPSGTRVDEGVWRIENETKIVIEAKLNGVTPVIVGSQFIPDVAIGTDLLHRTE